MTFRQEALKYLSQANMSNFFLDKMGIISVKSYGAVGDGVTDDTVAIQDAVDEISDNGGGVLYFPVSSYKVSSAITLCSNIFIIGANDSYVFNDTSSASAVFEVIGTSGSRLTNVNIFGLKIRNGTASTTAYIVGKDGIKVEYCDGFTLRDCEITEIQGVYGLRMKYSTDVHIEKNRFYRWTHTGCGILVECENIYVEKNEFDTCLIDETSVYTILMGAETLGEGDFFCKNVYVKGNRFLNNPNWEGIDCHGGENIWIEDNYVENCSLGISMGIADGYVTNPVLKNVHVIGNRLVQGTGDNNHEGIVVAGTNNTLIAEDIYIERNSVYGFGELTTANATIGAIATYQAKNVHIIENTIDNYAQAAIMLYGNVRGCKIKGNKIKDCRGAGSPTEIVAFFYRSDGLFGIEVFDNIIEPTDTTKAPCYIAKSSVVSLHTQIRNNTATHLTTGLYIGAALPVEKSSIPTDNFIGKYGDIVTNNNGKPGWYVSGLYQGYSSLLAGVIVTGNITAGQNVLTIASNQTGSSIWLPEGMNIVIAGAGTAGANLNAKVMKNNDTTLTLSVNAETTVTGANVTYRACTLTT